MLIDKKEPRIPDFDEVKDKMIASTTKFNVDRVKQEDVAKVGGAPAED